MQLERLLQSQGFGTRRECRARIRAGQVALGGTVCDDPFVELDPAGLAFTVDGEEWTYRAPACVMLHKPAGYECSRKPKHHPAVFALLPDPLVQRGLQCVGRLDEDTTGLLLLTDDGPLIHTLTSPRKGVLKRYRVNTKHPVDATLVARLLEGVQLHDAPEPVHAVACEASGEHELLFTIGEGRYHQVKRMVAAAGNRVETLQRIAVGRLDLPADLAPGHWRWVDPQDIA